MANLEELLIKAKNSETEAKELKRYSNYLSASPQGKFDILMAEGVIPRDSKFDSVDSEGNILYFPPYPGAEVSKNIVRSLEKKFKAIPVRNQRTIIALALHRSKADVRKEQEQYHKAAFVRFNYDRLSTESKQRVLYSFARRFNLTGKSYAELEKDFRKTYSNSCA